jgi:hypothetical protein
VSREGLVNERAEVGQRVKLHLVEAAGLVWGEARVGPYRNVGLYAAYDREDHGADVRGEGADMGMLVLVPDIDVSRIWARLPGQSALGDHRVKVHLSAPPLSSLKHESNRAETSGGHGTCGPASASLSGQTTVQCSSFRTRPGV